jgi:4-hydroxy-tetrahydrodipicolinate synthase
MKLEGAMTALVTPFTGAHADEIDERALIQLVEDQLAAGIDALVPCGTTGESVTMSVEEQRRVIQIVVKAARKRVPIIAGAGSNSTHHAIELARGAKDAGADALLVVTPYYNRPTQDGLVRHYRAIAEAVPLPIVAYNVPSRTQCDLLPETLAKMAEIPQIVAVKEATASTVRATQIIARTPGITVLSGDDFTMFPLFACGARGVISVISNIAPRWVADMWDAAAAGDWNKARELHFKIQPLTELLFAESSPSPIKACMALAGKMKEDLRPPLYPVTPALREKLKATLVSSGLA